VNKRKGQWWENRDVVVRSCCQLIQLASFFENIQLFINFKWRSWSKS
jgi:hypothetical protein